MWLEQIREPGDLRDLSYDDLADLAGEIRDFIVAAVAENAGHLGSNLGVVELTLALHRVFDSPRDASCGTPGTRPTCTSSSPAAGPGSPTCAARRLSGYPSRRRAGTTSSRTPTPRRSSAMPMASPSPATSALDRSPPHRRRHRRRLDDRWHVVRGAQQPRPQRQAGHRHPQRQRPQLRPDDLQPDGRPHGAGRRPRDGADHQPHRRRPLALPHRHPPQPGVRPAPAQARGARPRRAPRRLPRRAGRRGRQGCRPRVPPTAGVLRGARRPLRRSRRRARSRASSNRRCATPSSCLPRGRSSSTSSHRRAAATRRPRTTTRSTSTTPPCSIRRSGRRRPFPTGYTQTFAETVIKLAEADHRIVAITAAMPGPTGLLPFQERFPERFFDVGIAEQHAVTAAAGMAMGGMRPIVAIYSTFLNRAWDQVVYDVALHRLPVVFCIDRAGITGPTGRATTACTTWRCSPGCRGCAARPVERPGAAGDDGRRHAPRRRSGGHPLPARGAPPGGRARGRLRPRRPPWSGRPPTRELGVCDRHRQARRQRRTGRRRSSPRPGSTSPCGTPGVAPRSTSRMLADAALPNALVTVEDGVREGGIGGDRRLRRRTGPCGRAPWLARPADAVHPPRRDARRDPGGLGPRRDRCGGAQLSLNPPPPPDPSPPPSMADPGIPARPVPGRGDHAAELGWRRVGPGQL